MVELDRRRSQIDIACRLLHLVRTNKREQAEAMLRTELDCVPPEFAIPDAHDIKIGGWNDLLESFVEADDRLASRGECLAVVALDLVNRRHFGSQDGRYPQHDEVFLAARFYGPAPEQWTQDCPRRLLNAAQRSHALYTWRRNSQRPTHLTIRGLDALAEAQRRLGPPNIGSNPDAERATFVAGWLLWLATERAVARTVARRGLPREMPVIFGVDTEDRPMEVNAWDYGPSAESLHLASAAPLDHEQRDRLRAKRLAKQAAEEDGERRAREAFRAKLRSGAKLIDESSPPD
jgi:hypothetical protein